jgi:hypothetical protein
MPRVSLNRPDLKLDPDDAPGFRAAMWQQQDRRLDPAREDGKMYRLGTELDPYDGEGWSG